MPLKRSGSPFQQALGHRLTAPVVGEGAFRGSVLGSFHADREMPGMWVQLPLLKRRNFTPALGKRQPQRGQTAAGSRSVWAKRRGQGLACPRLAKGVPELAAPLGQNWPGMLIGARKTHPAQPQPEHTIKILLTVSGYLG